MTSDEIRTIFFAECDEALASAERALEACRDQPDDMAAVNDVFRSVHSIKGGAGAFGYTALQQYTHGFETLLSDVRDGAVPVTAALLDLLLRALDLLGDHVTAAAQDGAGPDDTEMLTQLAMAQANPPEQAGSAPSSAANEVPQVSAQGNTADTANDDGGFDLNLDFDLDAMLNDISAEITPETAAWCIRVKTLIAGIGRR